MTPTNFMYFDYAQSLQEDSVTFGSHTPLDEVYSYNPVPKQLNQQQAKYILGGQANLWTEYISNPRKVEYQVFPRISALSEVLWTEPAKKNFSDFENRLQKQLQRYGMWSTNYSNAHFGLDVSITPAPAYKGLQVKLQSRDKAGKITYGIVGRHLQKNYSKPLILTEDAVITTILTNNGRVTDSATVNLKINKATGKKITIVNPPLSGYTAEGGFTLVNGIINEMGLARSNEFLGYRGSNMLAKIDLVSMQRIDSVIVHAIIIGGSRVYPPESVEVYQSTDGKNFRSIGKTSDFVSPIYGKGVFTVRLPPTSTRYVQVAVRPVMKIAEGKTGAGEQALMFVDEIEIK